MQEYKPTYFFTTVLLFLILANGMVFGQTDFLNTFDTTTRASDTRELKSQTEKQLELFSKQHDVELKKVEYQLASLQHRQEVFAWQLLASKIIFILVLVIVCSGLVLSYLHFYKDLRASGAAGGGAEIEINLKGLKINSSIIGLLILFLSIAFLYLYLVFVFPINELNIDLKGSNT